MIAKRLFGRKQKIGFRADKSGIISSRGVYKKTGMPRLETLLHSYTPPEGLGYNTVWQPVEKSGKAPIVC